MENQEIILLLETMVNASRENRTRVSNIVLNDKTLLQPLVETVFDIDNKLSIKASWVLEFILYEKLDWLIPYLDYFTNNISKVHFDSVIRPTSKICEFLAISYISEKPSAVKDSLTEIHIEKIIEAAFDWMITDQKVAAKAYAMHTLFFLGKKVDWVHVELQKILEQEMAYGSAGYKARGKKVLQWIKKFQD